MNKNISNNTSLLRNSNSEKNKTLFAQILRPTVAQRVVQYAFLLFFIGVGVQFFFYAQWSMGYSDVYVARPPSVEAFLPLSALLGLKRLVMTGQYDFVHPAGLTILLFALATAIFLRKGFCGFLCPVGTVSMVLGRLGKKLGIQRNPRKIPNILLSIPKYLLLLFFVQIIIIVMSLSDIEEFIRTPYNMVADTKMLLFFLHPGLTLLIALVVLVLGSMLFSGFWCQGFCPYGAMLGCFSWISPVAVRREVTTCTGCRRCSRACPQRIAVHEKVRVSGPECLGCLACVEACPEPDCLTPRLGYSTVALRLPGWSLAVATVLLLALFFSWATATEHWKSRVAPEMMRMYHRNIGEMVHP